MATIKITDLPSSSGLQSNTLNDIFVGVNLSLPRTEKYTAKQIAEGLYVDNPLNVGGAPLVLRNTLGQFIGANPQYTQLNVQNFDPSGTTDFVATGDIGNDDTGFCNFGMAGGVWSKAGQNSILPYDGYLHIVGPTVGATTRSANLVLSAGSVGSNVVINAGGRDKSNTVAVFSSNTITLVNSTRLVFPDGTIQTSASVNVNSAIQTLNTDIQTANAFLQANDYLTLGVAQAYTDTANVYNTTLRDQANTFLQSNDSITLNSSRIYTDGTNNWIQNWIAGGGAPVVSQAQFNSAVGALNANDFTTLTVAQGYTDSVNANVSVALTDIRTSIQTTNTWNTNYTNDANTYLQALFVAEVGIQQNYTDTANLYNQGLISTVNAYSYGSNTFNQVYTDTANTWNKNYTDEQVFSVGNSNTFNQLYTDTANVYLQGLIDTANLYNTQYTDSTNTYVMGLINTVNVYAYQANTAGYQFTTDSVNQANNWNKNYTDTANNYATFVIGVVAGDLYAANNFLQANDYLTWTTAQAYTDTANNYANTTYLKYANTNVVFAGNVTVPGTLTTNTSSLICVAGLPAANTVANGADFRVPLVAQYDPNGWWNSTANTLTPTVAGWYQVNAQVWWSQADGTGTGQMNAQVRKNGSTVVISQDVVNYTTGRTLPIGTIVYMNGTTDALDLSAYTSNTGGQALATGNITDGRSSGTFLQIHFIR